MTAGRHIVSKSHEWGTPQKYVDAVNKVFDNQICLDPCSNKYSITNADTQYILPKQNGLVETWDFPKIYVNPPYGIDKRRKTKINNWLEKCAKTHQKYGSEILALIPVAPNTGHWKNNIFGKAEAICFLNDTRLKFLINGKDCGTGAPMACSMIYWGGHFKKFERVFKKYGAVVSIASLKSNTS